MCTHKLPRASGARFKDMTGLPYSDPIPIFSSYFLTMVTLHNTELSIKNMYVKNLMLSTRTSCISILIKLLFFANNGNIKHKKNCLILSGTVTKTNSDTYHNTRSNRGFQKQKN